MSHREDPAGSHTFALEVDGLEIAHFLECRGLRTASEVFELEEGGLNDRVHRLVGEAKWSNVTLRYATNVSRALWQWRERCREGAFGARSTAAITLYDADGGVVERFDLVEVWPVRWTGPEPDASASRLAVEELELAHEGIRVV